LIHGQLKIIAVLYARSTIDVGPRTAIEMNWIPAFAGMTDEEKINRGSWVLGRGLKFLGILGNILL
jgi:hypothetical protein